MVVGVQDQTRKKTNANDNENKKNTLQTLICTIFACSLLRSCFSLLFIFYWHITDAIEPNCIFFISCFHECAKSGGKVERDEEDIKSHKSIVEKRKILAIAKLARTNIYMEPHGAHNNNKNK